MKCFRVSLFLALPLLAQFVSGLALPEAALVARQVSWTILLFNYGTYKPIG